MQGQEVAWISWSLSSKLLLLMCMWNVCDCVCVRRGRSPYTGVAVGRQLSELFCPSIFT